MQKNMDQRKFYLIFKFLKIILDREGIKEKGGILYKLAKIFL